MTNRHLMGGFHYFPEVLFLTTKMADMADQPRVAPCVYVIFVEYFFNDWHILEVVYIYYTSRSVIIMFIKNISHLNRWYSWRIHHKSGAKKRNYFRSCPGCPNQSPWNQLYSNERKLIPTDNWSSIWIKMILAMKYLCQSDIFEHLQWFLTCLTAVNIVTHAQVKLVHWAWGPYNIVSLAWMPGLQDGI